MKIIFVFPDNRPISNLMVNSNIPRVGDVLNFDVDAYVVYNVERFYSQPVKGGFYMETEIAIYLKKGE